MVCFGKPLNLASAGPWLRILKTDLDADEAKNTRILVNWARRMVDADVAP